MTETSRPDLTDLAKLKPKSRKRVWLGLALVILAAALWLFWPKAEQKLAYETRPVTRGDLVVSVIATGTVQPTTQVELSSELSGTLSSVDVDYNDEVAEGQVLAKLDDTKLRAQVLNAEAQLVSARAKLTSAKATASETAESLTTAKELDKRGLNQRLSLVSAQAAFDRAQAAVETAEADVSLAEANLALQQADLEKAEIRSPIKGIVLSRAAEKGQIVAASLNAPILFTLAEDLSRMELRVSVDEADIGRVAVGQKASFTVDAYAGRRFDAEITSLRYAPDETTSDVVSYTAVLTVSNDDLVLRPGMTATATITVSEEKDSLLVPVTALRYAPPVAARSDRQRSGGGLMGLIMPSPGRGGASGMAAADGKSVWVLRNGQPERVEVRVGASDGTNLAVASEVLQEGDQVILSQRAAR